MEVGYSLQFTSEPKDITNIIFQPRNLPWIMKITADGKIKFNRDEYPNLTECEFAEKVVELLEEIKIKR